MTSDRLQRRHLLLLVWMLAVAWTGCSRGSERGASATPMAPSAVGSPSVSLSVQQGVSHPLDVLFPPRNEPFDFRSRLEAKYRDQLRRSSTSTYVDNEGSVVWTQEYLRYRVNACDHNAAVQKVFSQIDAGGVAAVCGSTQSAFPPRNEALDFRRQLESKYQTQLRRLPVATFVDMEGEIVWTTEYLRYRVDTCDHQTAVQKVFAQIDGGGVQPGCAPAPCVYTVSPASHSVPSGGGNLAVTLSRTSGGCSWSATADASFITLTGPTSGADPATVSYSVAPNTSTATRTGTITFVWSGGSTQVVITQTGAAPVTVFAAFRMFDPSRQASATTECQFRSLTGGPTTCTLDGSSSFTTGINVVVSYSWTVQYTYVTQKTLVQSGPNPRFSFTDTCGQLSSTDEGAAQPLSVQLTVVDSGGNTATVTSGAGSQPALQVTLFTCGK